MLKRIQAQVYSYFMGIEYIWINLALFNGLQIRELQRMDITNRLFRELAFPTFIGLFFIARSLMIKNKQREFIKLLPQTFMENILTRIIVSVIVGFCLTIPNMIIFRSLNAFFFTVGMILLNLCIEGTEIRSLGTFASQTILAIAAFLAVAFFIAAAGEVGIISSLGLGLGCTVLKARHESEKFNYRMR